MPKIMRSLSSRKPIKSPSKKKEVSFDGVFKQKLTMSPGGKWVIYFISLQARFCWGINSVTGAHSIQTYHARVSLNPWTHHDRVLWSNIAKPLSADDVRGADDVSEEYLALVRETSRPEVKEVIHRNIQNTIHRNILKYIIIIIIEFIIIIVTIIIA